MPRRHLAESPLDARTIAPQGGAIPRTSALSVSAGGRKQTPTLVGVVDVHYRPDESASTALCVYSDATCTNVVQDVRTFRSHVAPYVPGEFFRRELPCVEDAVLASPPLSLLIIDGYATLDAAGRSGLGVHLHQRLGLPIIGIAKTRYQSATHAIEVARGLGTKPVYVTSCGGLGLHAAAAIVTTMAGSFRLPDAARRADRLARAQN